MIWVSKHCRNVSAQWILKSWEDLSSTRKCKTLRQLNSWELTCRVWPGELFLLRGRFYQELLPKWQRKLGAPNTDETFSELYDRARMLEKHELQYVASAAVRKENQQGKNKILKIHKVPSRTEDCGNASPSQSTSVQKSSGNNKLYFVCKSPSHCASDCPKSHRREATGRGKPSATTSMIAPMPLQELEQLADEQLEDIPAKRKLEREQELLLEAAHVDMLHAKEGSSGAVGCFLCLKVKR